MENFFPLLSSEQSKTVTYDCAFKVVRANREVFEKETDVYKDEDSQQEDEVKAAFVDRKYCNVVVVTSPTNDCSAMFPFIKEKDEK